MLSLYMAQILDNTLSSSLSGCPHSSRHLPNGCNAVLSIFLSLQPSHSAHSPRRW